MASIPSTNLIGLIIVIPQQDEQKNILCFINTETAKIDALIAESQTTLRCSKNGVQSYAAVTGKIDVSAFLAQEAV